MKIPLAIFLGCSIVAIALYLGLTHDKRSWMNACLKEENGAQYLCEKMYRVK